MSKELDEGIKIDRAIGSSEYRQNLYSIAERQENTPREYSASLMQLKKFDQETQIALDRNVKEAALIVLGLTLGVPNQYFWKVNDGTRYKNFRDAVSVPNIRKSLEKVQIHELRELLAKILIESGRSGQQEPYTFKHLSKELKSLRKIEDLNNFNKIFNSTYLNKLIDSSEDDHQKRILEHYTYLAA